MAELGSDFSCVFDLDENLSVVSGRYALAQAAARRLFGQRGSLFYDPNWGGGLTAFIGAPVPRASDLERAIVREVLEDERIQDAAAKVSLVGEDLSISVLLEDGDGPFNLTIKVSGLTVEILAENL